MSQRTYTALDGESLQEPQTLLLKDYRTPRWTGKDWVIPQRPASAVTVIASFLSVTARPGTTVGLDPIIVSEKGSVLMDYTLPDGYVMWPDYDPRTYVVRRILHELTFSIKESELASQYTDLVRHYFGTTRLSLPERTLESNLEAVRYMIAFLFDLSELPELPDPTTHDAEAAIALAIEAALIAQHMGAAAKELLEKTWNDVLQ